MAKFYIVAREENNYTLITINNGDSLEDIDIFTSNFKDKDTFINYLNEQGYNLSDEVDLYAFNKGKNEFYHRDLIYGNEEIATLAKASKVKRLNTTEACNKLLNKVKEDTRLQLLIRREHYDLYGDLKNMILTSLGSNYVKIGKNRNWMRNNYYVGRDALATLDLFRQEKGSLSVVDIEELIANQKMINQDREKLDYVLSRNINRTNEQMSFLEDPKNFINLTYINKEKLVDPTNKKIKKMRKVGIINEKSLDRLTIPINAITDKIDYLQVNEVANCLINLPYRKVKWGQKERYEVDFKKLATELNIELNEVDEKFLNSLLDTRLRKQAYWCRYYLNQQYPSMATKREGYSYNRSFCNSLKNSAKKKSEIYNKAYNFYLIYQEMIKEKDNNRGSYGR